MPEPIKLTKLTAKEEAKLRAQFAKDGREAVRQKLYVGAYSLTREGEAAARWLREKEIEQEARERKLLEYAKWTWDAALAAAVLAAIAVVVAVMALPQERIKAIEESGAELVKAAKGLGETLSQ
jgi:predicted membrane-bound mannosyltransferase